MDLGIVLHRKQQIVEGLVRGALGERRESLLRGVHSFAPHGLAQKFAARTAFREFDRLHLMQHLLFAPAPFLNAIGIPVKHLEDRQRLPFGRKLQGHVQRRGQGHHGMESDIVLAAKRARIGQRARRDEPPQVRARPQLLRQCGQQTVDRRFLHQANQRFQRAKHECLLEIIVFFDVAGPRSPGLQRVVDWLSENKVRVVTCSSDHLEEQEMRAYALATGANPGKGAKDHANE